MVFVAILDERLDDYNRKVFVPQIEGSKTSLELPGIVDEVVTLAEIKAEDGSTYRAFVTHTVNPYGFPAKDRSGRLDLLEPREWEFRPGQAVYLPQHYKYRRIVGSAGMTVAVACTPSR